MWGKLTKKKLVSGQARTLNTLEEARSRGDTRAEIALSMALIGEEVQQIQEALTRIEDLYSGRLEDLLDDASSYFPANVAVDLNEIDGYVYDVRERTDFLFSRITSLLKTLNTHLRGR